MPNVLSLKELDGSELFGAFKENRLKGPNAVAFDRRAWVDAAAAISQPTIRDTKLLYAALHFGLEFKSLRSIMELQLPRLAPTDAVDLVVAAINVQANTVTSRTAAKQRKRSRGSDVVYLGDAGDVRVRNAGHQYLNPDDAMATLVDGMANLLYRASEAERVSSAVDRETALRSAQALVILASIEQGLKELWGRAAWNGYTITNAENRSVFSGDKEFAKLWLAWQRRFETLMLQEARLQQGEAMVRNDRSLRSPILTRTVLSLEERTGRKQEYIIGKARQGGDEQASTLSALEATYLKPFLDERLPNCEQADLTYRDLWRVWWVLQDIAKVHQARMPTRGLVSWGQMDRCVLRFSVSRAIKAVADSSGLSQSSAETVMDVFTTDPDLTTRKRAGDLFQHGTWGRPIVRSRGEDRGRIVLASLMSPNPVLTMERWMTLTGMNDDPKNRRKKTVRGKVFERVARERLGVAGARNRSLTGFHVAYLPARGEGSEEIDALFRFGSTIAVCELKCLSVPFGSLDRYNHLGKIEEAVAQVNRKVEWSRKNTVLIFDALSIPEGERNLSWNFVPVVVLNTPFGAGLALDGCAVTDLDWMSTFLGSSHITIGGTFERARGVSMRSRTVYRDQADLELRFADIAASPPSLAFELSRIEWELVPFPTQVSQALLLEVPVSKGAPNPLPVP